MRKAVIVFSGAIFMAGLAFLVMVLVSNRAPDYRGGAGSRNVLLEQLYKAPTFRLSNLDNREVSNEDLQGAVWIVDFIFTRCQGPCPLMTQRMKSIQQGLLKELSPESLSAVRLVSITVDPEHDSPAVLKLYAESWGADASIWLFLSGDEQTIVPLVRDGFKIALSKGMGESHGAMQMPAISHGTSFLLIDREGWVCRIYDLDDPALPGVAVRDVEALLGS